jgi:hypothetical protein
MSNKRPTKTLREVIKQARLTLIAEYGFKEADFQRLREQVEAAGHAFAEGCPMVEIDMENPVIDYQVQRDLRWKNLIQIITNFDPRLVRIAEGCIVTANNDGKIQIYDGQHTVVAMGLLGYTAVPLKVVRTEDPSFPSYAFEMLNETGISKLTPGDLHRNRLTRFDLGNRELKTVQARKMQDAFDFCDIDLCDKNARKSMGTEQRKPWFFSHFKFAQKGIELDKTGQTLRNILEAIISVYPDDEEVNQDLYIGLYELSRLDEFDLLPEGWMTEVLQTVAKTYPRSTMFSSTGQASSLFKNQCKIQVEHISPGRTWSAPQMMSNFLREVYMLNGGSIALPTHGSGANLQISVNPSRELVLA